MSDSSLWIILFAVVLSGFAMSVGIGYLAYRLGPGKRHKKKPEQGEE